MQAGRRSPPDEISQIESAHADSRRMDGAELQRPGVSHGGGTPSGMDQESLIELGQVGAAFGVRGWVKLNSFTEPPERLFEHRSLRLGMNGSWTRYEIEAQGRSSGRLTAKLVGVNDRDQARSLTGARICVPRGELPERGDGDFYRADLIGCEVVNQDGRSLGVVQHFVETPAHALMVVRGEREHWVPALPTHVRRVDLQARRVTVDWDAG